jgi:hypothetical protein
VPITETIRRPGNDDLVRQWQPGSARATLVGGT